MILACAWSSRAHWLVLTLCVAVTTAGGVLDKTALIYPPMFVVGVILALRRAQVHAWFSGVTTAWWIVIAAAATLAITSRWMVMAFDPPRQVSHGTTGVMLMGAVAFLIIALEWPFATKLLSSRPLGWLGMVSFSLYLVHEPIVVAAGFAFRDNPGAALLTALAVTAVVTPMFYYFVERPSIHLATRVRTTFSDRRSTAKSTSRNVDALSVAPGHDD